MIMAQLTTHEAPVELHSLEEQNGRLLDLVGELLQTNQRLRCQVAALEQQTECTESALARASAVLPMLLP